MGHDLFGVDIAGIVHDNISDGILSATLTQRIEREPDESNLTAPPASTYADHPCNGFTDGFTLEEVGQNDVLKDDRKITIIGDSLPAGIIPQKGDKIFIEDLSFDVLGIIDRDPAAATYLVHARR